MIFYELKELDEMPKSCLECPVVELCSLPQKKKRIEVEVKAAYRTKRHKDCPLIVL